MLQFNPVQDTLGPAHALEQETPYGSLYGRVFVSRHRDQWFAYVSFQVGPDVVLERHSPAGTLADEAAARAWIATAIDEGPWFVVGVLPERRDQ